MSKDFFDKIAGSKVFCVIFSIIVAIALWFYIDYVENPEDSVVVSNIPLTFVGVETLESRNLMLGDGVEQTVSLRFYGKRSIVTRLNNSNVTAYIDVTDIRSVGEKYQGYNVAFPDWVDEDTVSISAWNPRNVSFTVVQRSSREIEIEGKLIGGVEEGYSLGEITCSPNRITVSGPQELISTIDHAEVRLERENVTSSISTTSGFVLVDARGNEIPTDELTLSTTEVAVEVEILTVKEVPLDVDILDGGGATKADVLVDIQPKTVEITGDAATVAGISKISLGTVDLSKFRLTFEENMTILFPDDVNNVTGITTASVTVELSSEYEIKQVSTTNFEFVNAEGMSPEMVTESLDVTIRAKSNVIGGITGANLRVVVDLSDLSQTKGLVPVKARVYVDGYSTAGAIGDYNVMVQLN